MNIKIKGLILGIRYIPAKGKKEAYHVARLQSGKDTILAEVEGYHPDIHEDLLPDAVIETDLKFRFREWTSPEGVLIMFTNVELGEYTIVKPGTKPIPETDDHDHDPFADNINNAF